MSGVKLVITSLTLSICLCVTTTLSKCKNKCMVHVLYSSVVGSIINLSVCTKLDLTQTISLVSRYMINLGYGHWLVVKRTLRYLKGTIIRTYFTKVTLYVFLINIQIQNVLVNADIRRSITLNWNFVDQLESNLTT